MKKSGETSDKFDKVIYNISVGFALLCAVLIVVFLALLCVDEIQNRMVPPPIVDNVKIEIGESGKFTDEEIHSAMESVEKAFCNRSFPEEGWRGCELQNMSYNENKSDYAIEEFSRDGGEPDNRILIESIIFVGPESRTVTSPKNRSIYWCWMLKRVDAISKWEVVETGIF